MSFERLISSIGAELTNAGIPYMIIGGHAVLLYGEPRLTKDIDITLGIDTDRENELREAIKKLKLEPLISDDTFIKRTMVLPTIDVDSKIRVDFIFSFTPYEQQAIKRGKKISICNVIVNYASIEDLIIHKIFAGRPRDLEDVNLILLKNRDIDHDYIRKWLAEFDRSAEESSFLKTYNELVRRIDKNGLSVKSK
ncbi:MAG: nucleotidyl transferase AbiEii/AbiGii toxin family protein [Desulfatiglandales bacterium]